MSEWLAVRLVLATYIMLFVGYAGEVGHPDYDLFTIKVSLLLDAFIIKNTHLLRPQHLIILHMNTQITPTSIRPYLFQVGYRRAVEVGSRALVKGGAFVVSLAFWVYILFEVFAGELSDAASNDTCVGDGCDNKTSQDRKAAGVRMAYSSMQFIITVCWSVYPFGYFLNAINGQSQVKTTNIVFNFADIVNKCLFGLSIYFAAREAAGNAKCW